MKNICIVLSLIISITACSSDNSKISNSETFTISKEDFYNKVKGGLVGQILGNLNGLPYEQTYNNEPGTLTNYIPSLPKGAFTDDDTDVEWVHIYYMEKENNTFLPFEVIQKAWLDHIYYYIYSANAYARELMTIDIKPPLTGNIFVNPWSKVNVAGQFCCETYAFTAPGMCKSAEEIGMHYTSISVDEEPLQSTQLFTAMISRAFETDDLNDILQTGLSTLDKSSLTYEAVMYAIKIHDENPNDWLKARKEIRRKYYFVDNSNKSIRNTAAIISEYLYGEGDFVKTMEITFNWGFDADCNAATIASILGVIKGYKWFEEQGWDIADKYCNTGRPGMPEDETISKFTQRIVNVGEKVITDNGGRILEEKGKKIYEIQTQKPACIKKVRKEQVIFNELMSNHKDEIYTIFDNNNATEKELARATYLSFCLRIAEDIKYDSPKKWQKGIDALMNYPELVYNILIKGSGSYIAHIAKRTGLKFIAPKPQMDGKYTFKLDGHLDARKVYLGGTFDGNNWESWKMPMKRTETGWITKIDIKPGKYNYKFIVDGKAIFDPANPNKETNCEDRTNSVIEIND